ncbi:MULTISPECIES: eCIS core domain-containing protein [unclassified Streptomyces]|uniref:eCIS core domain-containing protein n=1 Tax=unclassified Streptomyces TaxID=2593676 RepID=UPI004042CB84
MPAGSTGVRKDSGSGNITERTLPAHSGATPKTPTCSRPEACPAPPAMAPPLVADVLATAGRPLDRATRSRMEDGFTHDFSQVRLHSDARAAQSAKALGALAYTVGRNVVFGAGQYREGSRDGERLLTHELAHVVQQDGLRGGGPSTALPLAAEESLEREAHIAADVVAGGGHTRIVGRVTPCLQRQLENLRIGELGELYVAQAVEQSGRVVFHDWGKFVTTRGIDLVVWDPGTGLAWLVDNKAWSRPLYDAPALSGPQFQRNLETVKAFLFSNAASKEASAALKAVNAGRYLKVVSNFNAMGEAGVSPTLFARGLVLFDAGERKIFYNHAAWLTSFSRRPVQRGIRMTGKHGFATVGRVLIAVVLTGGTLYLARNAGTNVKQVVEELAVQGVLDSVLVRIAGRSVGTIASFTLGLESDEPASVTERRKKIDAIIAALPELHYDALSETEQQEVRNAVGKLVDNPVELPPPPPPTYPAAPAAGISRPLPGPPPPLPPRH